MNEKIKTAFKRVKCFVLSIVQEFKCFNYKSLTRKDGWISFVKNRKMLISCIAVVAVIIIIPTSIGNRNNHQSADTQKIYEALCNVNTAGGKFDKAISSVMSVTDINITQDETGLYLVSITGLPYSNQPGLDAYKTIIVTYSVKSEAGGCAFVSCKGKTEFGETFNIDYSVWNTVLQASMYN